MKLSDTDRQRLEELAGDDGIPEGIISADGDVDLNKLNKWIASRVENATAAQARATAQGAASVIDEDEQRWEAERRQKIIRLRELLAGLKEDDDDDDCYFLLSDEEKAARKAEDEAAYDEMVADGIDVFAYLAGESGENSLPRDIARMIAETLIPNTLLKEEIALLKTQEGRNYIFERMYDVAKTKEAVRKGNCNVKRCYPKWMKCECY
jgi:hypothetical protein